MKIESTTKKTEESDIEKIFRLIRKFIPEDQIQNISYSQRIDANGCMDSTMRFERLVLKSSLILDEDLKTCLDNSMPKALIRYCREWNMHYDHTYVRCTYDIFIPNAPVIASQMKKELFSKYSNEFHTELEKVLESK